MLVRDGRLVTRNGRLVLGRCARCCSGQCAYRRYEPCIVELPSPECPVPEDAYITECWRCTTGSGPLRVDPDGYCWRPSSDSTRYLPDPGTGDPPPAGYQWLPEGATVWSDTEGPCAGSCTDPACKTYDEYLPARRCECSPPGPEVKYLRCRDYVPGRPCVVVNDSAGRCYELARDLSPVPGPVDPSLVLPTPIPVGGHPSCCRCCDLMDPDSPCETGNMPLIDFDACPLVSYQRSVEVCCDGGEVYDVGYWITTFYDVFGSCPASTYEHWWSTQDGVRTLWYRYVGYDGQCSPIVDEGQRTIGPVLCDSRLSLLMHSYRGFGGPEPDPNYMALFCDGSACEPLVVGRLRETTAWGTFYGQVGQPTGPSSCAVGSAAQGAVVRYVMPGGSGCARCSRTISPPAPDPPQPPAGGDGPEALGFRRGWRRTGQGIVVPTVSHPHVPSVIGTIARAGDASLTLAMRTRRRAGCRSCGDGGGLW